MYVHLRSYFEPDRNFDFFQGEERIYDNDDHRSFLTDQIDP